MIRAVSPSISCSSGRLALRLQEKKESCKKEALESHGKRLEAAIEMRRELYCDHVVAPARQVSVLPRFKVDVPFPIPRTAEGLSRLSRLVLL